MAIAIFGACREGREVLQLLRAACIVNKNENVPICFLDNDSRLIGSQMDGLPIYSPIEARNLPIDKVVIGVIFNQQVTSQLQQILRDDQEIQPFFSNDYYSHEDRRSGMAFIGAYSYYRPSTLLLNVSIGRYCHVGADCRIGLIGHDVSKPMTYPLNYHNNNNRNNDVSKIEEANKERSKRSIIEDAVYIGESATILGGVHIGRGSVIGSRALVSKDVPPYSIAAGIPAQNKPRPLSKETISALEKSKWWEMDQSSAEQIISQLGVL